MKRPFLSDVVSGVGDGSIDVPQRSEFIPAAAAFSVHTSGFQLRVTQKNAPINNASNQNTIGDSKVRGCERA